MIAKVVIDNLENNIPRIYSRVKIRYSIITPLKSFPADSCTCAEKRKIKIGKNESIFLEKNTISKPENQIFWYIITKKYTSEVLTFFVKPYNTYTYFLTKTMALIDRTGDNPHDPKNISRAAKRQRFLVAYGPIFFLVILGCLFLGFAIWRAHFS